jgi:hypothetical protein
LLEVVVLFLSTKDSRVFIVIAIFYYFVTFLFDFIGFVVYFSAVCHIYFL